MPFSGLQLYPGIRTNIFQPTVIPLATETSVPKPPSIESVRPLPKGLRGRYHSISDYHALYLSGKVTPLGVVESLLPLIRRDLNFHPQHAVAFTQSNIDEIIEAAKLSTLRYKTGTPLSILDGVPLGVKDDTKVAGYRNTWGKRKDERLLPIASESSWPVQNWQRAGGIVMGKLNLSEMWCVTTNNNPVWGTPPDPHNDNYYPGGSSGGSAYAVSAGLVPVALGSDGGGNIRLPSSFCGIYGMKPSHGRLEDTHSTVSVNGPMAATMSDLEIAYRIMAVPNPSDPVGRLFDPPRPSKTLPKVIGIYKKWFDRADPSVLAVCYPVIDYFRRKLHYRIIEISIPYLSAGQTAHTITVLAEVANKAKTLASNPSDFLDGFTPVTQVVLGVAQQIPAGDYLAAQQLRNLLMCHLSHLYQQNPGMIIVTPTTPLAGWPIDQEIDLKYGCLDGNNAGRNMEYVWLANLCGNPVINCPAGYVDPVKGKGRIPVGLMGMGEWGAEDDLIEWGRDVEKWLTEEYPGGRVRPGNWEDVLSNAGAISH
ncbi:hypothetical protein BP5796_03508 [Coleophoma crateriformis]|uniref:Amidase domain-containing protein n=1 Tax=Coleophoma crateriformis TaxID=565419 RepID=A0A3D8SNP2_9HELO|nr:hypothetical protein BP5796_03508 [Coleophoma crateriformis]